MSGETVTPGKYSCTHCGERYEVEKPKVTNLPVCPRCQNDTWKS
jgi:DNA-directed RNA polymerase subunit RPC12/RpoP